ncbi:hypothetical protein [Streptomyces sp. RFCAC02]|uniref:hypothetical protein n=1 Tax=Streptomyces sp. RFCAC02 TaxID=2499143 RepID=UPI0010211FE5|nr:hypothetical protein [Streptomyces sp. RFCAC02]
MRKTLLSTRTRRSRPVTHRPWPACDVCLGPLWPDITAGGGRPAWVCTTCVRPRGRFWHRHTGQRCPFGYPTSLATDAGGGLHICA